LDTQERIFIRYPGTTGPQISAKVGEALAVANLIYADDLIAVLNDSPLYHESIRRVYLKKIDDIEKDLAAAKKAAGVA
jgi:hypothetical protein